MGMVGNPPRLVIPPEMDGVTPGGSAEPTGALCRWIALEVWLRHRTDAVFFLGRGQMANEGRRRVICRYCNMYDIGKQWIDP